MIVVNKDHNDAYNISHVVNIYMSSDGNTIKAVAGTSTRGGILGNIRRSNQQEKHLRFL